MSEWMEEVNQWGGVRRYRMVNGIKEYEPEVNGVPQSVFLEMNRRDKERREQERQAERVKQELLKICPFSDPGGAIARCSGDRCAFYVNDSCGAFRVWEDHKTLGLQCPMLCRQLCRRDCAFSINDGCTLLTE